MEANMSCTLNYSLHCFNCIGNQSQMVPKKRPLGNRLSKSQQEAIEITVNKMLQEQRAKVSMQKGNGKYAVQKSLH